MLSAALVESVARALTIAVSDPSSGHHRNDLASEGKKLRCARQAERFVAVFDSSAVPPISIDRYLLRLFATFKCSEGVFVAALVIVDRLLEYDGGRLPLTVKNVHRVFFASLVVSVKYLEDRVYSNAHYAKAGGVHVKELNRLERVLLVALDFDLRVSLEQFKAYEVCLLALGQSAETTVTSSMGFPQQGHVQEPCPCSVSPSDHQPSCTHPGHSNPGVVSTCTSSAVDPRREGSGRMSPVV